MTSIGGRIKLSGISGVSGSLLGEDAVISCPHGGRATPATTSNGPVLLNGVPVLTGAHTFVVAGCPHTVDGVPSPCVAVRFTADDTGITVDGAPVLLDTSAAQCFSAAFVAQGPPFVQATQREVTIP
ncbi:hypothetical protein ACFVTY_20345 [Streptomyces sp. NPDC058067]|uniref:hypothetical protein n=1 Tax=Streptomyces sp. NPDC058067 TaxID=3346324 RepID=UPI0036E6F1EF